MNVLTAGAAAAPPGGDANAVPFVTDPGCGAKAYAPTDGPPTTKRKVYFYIQILQLGHVSAPDQTFQAYFYVQCAWVEPEIPQSKIGEMREAMAAYDGGGTWPEGLFDPKLDFMNADAAIELTKSTIGYSPWRTGPNGEPVVEHKFFARGTFVESLELEHFPFDVQPLRISISSSRPATEIDLLEDPSSPSAMRPEFLANPEFSIKETLELGEGATQQQLPQPILVADEKLVGKRNQKFVILHAAVIAQRIPTYYVQNVFIPMFLIVLMEAGAFVIHPGDAADRFSVTLTLALVVVAYKCVRGWGGERTKRWRRPHLTTAPAPICMVRAGTS